MIRTLQFILLFSFFFATLAIGQMSLVNDQNFDIQGQSNETNITGYVEVEMGTDEVGEFYWELILDEEVPDDWVYSVCDGNSCYVGGQYLCPESKPNQVASGEKLKFSIYLNPNGKEGGWHDTKLRLFTTVNGEVTIMEPAVSWLVGLATSVEDTQVANDFTLFPNPTSDYFNIGHDGDVAQVSVYTILGKEMFSFAHEEGQAYSVADLEAGFYLARLIGYDNGNCLI